MTAATKASPKTIRWKVQEIARIKGYKSPRRLGLDCGIYPASIVPIWRGDAKQVALRTLERLCEHLGVEPADLISYEQEE